MLFPEPSTTAVDGRAKIWFPDPDTLSVVVLQPDPWPLESIVISPAIAGRPLFGAWPTLMVEPPAEVSAGQFSGSSSHRDGVLEPCPGTARMTADACVVRTNSFTTPPKKL